LDRVVDRPFNSYPVVDSNGVVVGAVRRADLATYRETDVKLADVATNGVVTLSPDAAVTDAIAAMAERHVDSVPVVDGDAHLVGIVTRTDVLRPQVDYLAHERAQAGWLRSFRLRGRAPSPS
jgi:CBS domain-containing protein